MSGRIKQHSWAPFHPHKPNQTIPTITFRIPNMTIKYIRSSHNMEQICFYAPQRRLEVRVQSKQLGRCSATGRTTMSELQYHVSAVFTKLGINNNIVVCLLCMLCQIYIEVGYSLQQIQKIYFISSQWFNVSGFQHKYELLSVSLMRL